MTIPTPPLSPNFIGPDDFRCAAPRAFDQDQTIAVDQLETSTLNGSPTLAFGLSSGELLMIKPRELRADAGLTRVLEQATLIGHELKSPLRHLLDTAGIRPHVIMDTSIADLLLRGVKQDGPSPGLVALGLKHLGQKWPNATDPDPRNRLAARLRLLHPLYSTLQAATDAAGLHDVLELELQALPVIAAMESTGVGIDVELLERAVRSRNLEIDELAARISEMLGIGSLGRSRLFREALESRLGCTVGGIDHEHLDRFRRNKVVATLLRWLDLTSSNPGDQLHHALLRSSDGRVRPSWNQVSGPTGRLTTRWPNLQSLPRAHGFRAAVIPAPGMSFVVADYSTIELRIAAALHGEHRLADAFRGGLDPHRVTAALLVGAPAEDITAEQRQLAKAVNFGLLYGMGPRSLADHVGRRVGVGMSEARARSFIERYFKSYRRLSRARDTARRRARLQNGHLEARSASGRLHRLPTAAGPGRAAMIAANARALMSSPIQGTCSDGLKSAMVLLDPQLRTLGARMVLCVHDEIVVECPMDACEECRRIVELAVRRHGAMGTSRPNRRNQQGMQELVRLRRDAVHQADAV